MTNCTDRIHKRLADAGLLVQVSDELVKRYPTLGCRLAPLEMEGKPLSQIVIEERGRDE